MNIEPGVKWQFNAWSEGGGSSNLGRPIIWSTYTFDTEKEAQKTRDRLEKQWKKETGYGPYTFEIYRVESTHVPRPPKRGKRR